VARKVRRKKSVAQAKNSALIPAKAPSNSKYYDRWRNGNKLFHNQNELIELVQEYARLCYEAEIPFLKTGFCVWLGIGQSTLSTYLRDPYFEEAREIINTLSEYSLLHGGLTEQLNPSMAKFVLSSKYDYRERVDATVETTGNTETPITINLIERKSDDT